MSLFIAVSERFTFLESAFLLPDSGLSSGLFSDFLPTESERFSYFLPLDSERPPKGLNSLFGTSFYLSFLMI